MARPESMAPVGHVGEALAVPGGRWAVAGSMAACERLFDGLAGPAVELHGVYRGRVAGLPGLGEHPAAPARLVAAVAPHLRFPWYGKAFDGGRGVNVWLTSSGRFQRFEYRVDYDRQAARLCYDQAGNPGVLRGLQAEVRSVAPGRYLCRAQHGKTVLLYFTLES